MVKFVTQTSSEMSTTTGKMSTSAIRRMHFKCGRILSSKLGSGPSCNSSPIPIPKVILMGSSTTSETTLINTSTDSNGTMTTNLTTTIEDSIDEPFDLLTNNNHMNVFDIDDTEYDHMTSTNCTNGHNADETITNNVNNNNNNYNNSNDLIKFLIDSKQNLLNVIENFTHSHNNNINNNNPDATNKTNKKRSPSMVSKRSNKKSTKSEKLPLFRIDCITDFFDITRHNASNPNNHHPRNQPQTKSSCRDLGRKNREKQASVTAALSSSSSTSQSTSSSPPINSMQEAANRSVHSSVSYSEDDLMARHQHQQHYYHQQQHHSTASSTIYLQPQVLNPVADHKLTMKHLLEMTSHLTIEELHDFEMRYGSPHHNRSQSMKTSADTRPNYLCLPQQRSRIASMPNTGFEEEYYRLRHFSTTGKGIVNRGDSLKSRRYRSNTSVASSNSSNEQLQINCSPGGQQYLDSGKNSASCSLASSRDSSQSIPVTTIVPYRVIIFGDTGVGKSSLVSQFMTSEYLHAYDTSIDDESGEKSISVLLDNEESDLIFTDYSAIDFNADLDLLTENVIPKFEDTHAYCIVYSIADRMSFNHVTRVLKRIWSLECMSSKALILVANKCDLVRSKAVSTEEGQAVATMYNCKYIETSVSINHNVDELLVGILTQIRLKLENPEKSRDLFLRKRSNSKKNLNRLLSRSPVKKMFEFQIETDPGDKKTITPMTKLRNSRMSASLRVKNFLGKVLYRESKSKSCENLHVL